MEWISLTQFLSHHQRNDRNDKWIWNLDNVGTLIMWEPFH